MQASHRVAMNTGILYARMGITVFISLYTTRVILNALGAGDFGIFNIVGGAIAMLTFLNTSMAEKKYESQWIERLLSDDAKKSVRKVVVTFRSAERTP